MVQYSENIYISGLKTLWKRCFPMDTDKFVDLYFSEVYQNGQSLVYLEAGQPVAFLQMIPYTIQTGATFHPAGYLSGIMTHPDCRKRGYMEELMRVSSDEMGKKGYDYTFLIPQEEWLIKVYEKFGFRLLEQIPQEEQAENKVLKTDAQIQTAIQDFLDEKGDFFTKDDIHALFRQPALGMIKRLNNAAPGIDHLYMTMMLDS